MGVNEEVTHTHTHTQRDLLVVHGISITVAALIFACFSIFILLIVVAITGRQQRLSWRLFWLPVSGLSIALIFSTPQLKHMIVKAFHRPDAFI
jgi:hypothetical protein